VIVARPGVDGFLFGCDPELFVINRETGEFVSAHGMIPGTKEEPHKVEHGAIQVDGMAVEFNIDPVNTPQEWDRNILAVLRQLKDALPEGHNLHYTPTATFTQAVLDAQPEVAKTMGCDPDYDAWTGTVNPPPDTVDNPLLRTAAGHVHIGWTNDEQVTNEHHVNLCRDLVKQLDWFLGAWAFSFDKDVTRRKMYGKAGAFRPKPYGAEYRVLSNAWLSSKQRRMAVWDRMQYAIEEMRRFNMPELATSDNNAIIQLINTGKRARTLSKHDFPLSYTDASLAAVALPARGV
jgi:hypothetical protein